MITSIPMTAESPYNSDRRLQVIGVKGEVNSIDDISRLVRRLAEKARDLKADMVCELRTQNDSYWEEEPSSQVSIYGVAVQVSAHSCHQRSIRSVIESMGQCSMPGHPVQPVVRSMSKIHQGENRGI